MAYEINPWMHAEIAPDRERAQSQWENLVATLQRAGAQVEVIEGQPDLPDMVFTANAGVVNGEEFVLTRFAHPQRAGEERHFYEWFSARGYVIHEFSPGTRNEGAGDALPFGGKLLAGYRIRSDFDSHAALSSATGVQVLSVELSDPRFYHVDLTFCPLDDEHALVAPIAWDLYGRRVVENLVPKPIVLTDEEALAFCANSVVVNDTIVMPSVTPRLANELEAIGLDIQVCDVSEFLKAGGGCRCLTLSLDVVL